MLRPILLATALCGTLDILFASALTISRGKAVGDMLRYVASGPFPAATGMGAAGAWLGLLVHFALMAIMVALFVIAAGRFPALLARPVVVGVAYGLLTYVALDLLILPLRFPAAWPPKPLAVGTQLFAHVVLVGIPTALIAARAIRRG